MDVNSSSYKSSKALVVSESAKYIDPEPNKYTADELNSCCELVLLIIESWSHRNAPKYRPHCKNNESLNCEVCKRQE